jgi:hypothetical protein
MFGGRAERYIICVKEENFSRERDVAFMAVSSIRGIQSVLEHMIASTESGLTKFENF